jgi:Lhr-like helicase
LIGSICFSDFAWGSKDVYPILENGYVFMQMNPEDFANVVNILRDCKPVHLYCVEDSNGHAFARIYSDTITVGG